MTDLTEYWDERARSHPPHYAVGFLGGRVENWFYRRAHVYAMRHHVLPLLEEVVRERGTVSVLEVGCGWGRWARAFTRWLGKGRVRYVGVDASEAMIERARTLSAVPGAQFLHLPGTRLTVSGPIDVAFSFTVLQHLPYEDQLETLRRMLTSLGPGGRIALVELLGEKQEAFHVFPRTVEGWRHAVEEAGGTVVSVAGALHLRAEVVAWNRSRWGNLLNRSTNLLKIPLYPFLEAARASRDASEASHVAVRAVWGGVEGA